MPVPSLQIGTELCPDSEGRGRYKIKEILGTGGFGITYRAYDSRLDGDVVIKELAFEGAMFRNTQSGSLQTLRGQETIREKLVRKFLQEARLLNRLRDPHIVRVTDVWEERGTAYYAMDEVEASRPVPPRPVHNAQGNLAWPRIEDIARQLLEALNSVHAAGLIHGDIKPDNALITDSGQLVLIDFGTARTEADRARTATSMAFTMGYAPPELMHPNRLQEAGPGSDLYSWAMVVIGLCIDHPTESGLPRDAYERILSEDPYDRFDQHLLQVGVPAVWASVLVRCIDLDPKNRPQSVGELRAALASATTAPAPAQDSPAATRDLPTSGETAAQPFRAEPGVDATNTADLTASAGPVEPKKKGGMAATFLKALGGVVVGAILFVVLLLVFVGGRDDDESESDDDGGTTEEPVEDTDAIAAHLSAQVVGRWAYDPTISVLGGAQQGEDLLQHALSMQANTQLAFAEGGTAHPDIDSISHRRYHRDRHLDDRRRTRRDPIHRPDSQRPRADALWALVPGHRRPLSAGRAGDERVSAAVEVSAGAR